jgi:transposase
LARGDLSDEEWAVIGELLPSERGRKARPSHDNRRFLDEMPFVLRAGWPWRDMHARYGKWNSVYMRFRRWAEQGIWDAMLETLVELGLTDDWQHMIDSTTVRGHLQAAGAPRGKVGRRIGMNTNGTMMADRPGYPSDFGESRQSLRAYQNAVSL